MIIVIKTPKWTIEEETGYKPITTFWQDFSTADCFGIKAVRDTYKRAFEEWKGDYKFLTELVLVLNHKIFQHFHTKKDLAALYDDLWKKTDQYAQENLKDEKLSYYYQTID